ncbi:unnamed protein product [Clonostachys byssicola]|uniref:Uncharacterized protein n=1 Tax=Clonostachys byssicola TaxID=160290 RepID=A0A9N9Y7K8_9HYPO|nr:unnamed protein product [Clonostachys byssicola]
MYPLSIHTPGWHGEGKTPVVDGKYIDRKTGKLCTAADDDHQEYEGPPAVDVIVKSQHADTTHCTYRQALAYPMEAILACMMKVVAKEKLEIDSVMATPYAIRIIISHELTENKFYELAMSMCNDVDVEPA